MKRVLLLLTASLLPLALQAAEPKPASATYQTRQGMMSATGIRTLEKQPNGQWLITSRAKVMMLELVESSLFEIHDGHVRPLRYDYVNPFSKKRSRTLQFDWPQQSVTETRGKRTFALEPNTLDRLSIQVQSQLDLCAAPDTFTGNTYAIADRKSIKHHVIEKVGSTELDTAVGKLKTIELKRYRRGEPEDATRIWVAPQWDCLLVKLEEHDDDGDPLELTLVGATVDGVEVKGE